MSWIILTLAANATFSGPATVVDGDTLRVGDNRVRLFGIDAPELSQMCGNASPQVACGKSAARWLSLRIQGRSVQCTVVDHDRYDRIVARCRIDGTHIGRALVETGWATAYRKYASDYVDVEATARAARRGIWALVFERPEAYRRARIAAVAPQASPNPDCGVKGNVNSKGARIYHLPGSRDYPAVRIDARRGERWFCSETEAAAAGWRPAR